MVEVSCYIRVDKAGEARIGVWNGRATRPSRDHSDREDEAWAWLDRTKIEIRHKGERRHDRSVIAVPEALARKWELDPA
jgi:hypothetical protein